jgi:hypothetical protein
MSRGAICRPVAGSGGVDRVLRQLIAEDDDQAIDRHDARIGVAVLGFPERHFLAPSRRLPGSDGPARAGECHRGHLLGTAGGEQQCEQGNDAGEGVHHPVDKHAPFRARWPRPTVRVGRKARKFCASRLPLAQALHRSLATAPRGRNVGCIGW